MRVIWTVGANEDARQIVARLAQRSPDAADRVAEAFHLAAERLSDFPRLGVSAGFGYRYLVLVRGRYRMLYRVEDESIRIFGLSRGVQPWPWFSA